MVSYMSLDKAIKPNYKSMYKAYNTLLIQNLANHIEGTNQTCNLQRNILVEHATIQLYYSKLRFHIFICIVCELVIREIFNRIVRAHGTSALFTNWI